MLSVFSPGPKAIGFAMAALLLSAHAAKAQTPVRRSLLQQTWSDKERMAIMIPLADGGGYFVDTAGAATRKDAQGAVKFTKPSIWVPTQPINFFAQYHYRESADGEVTIVRYRAANSACVVLKANGDVKLSKSLTAKWTDLKSAPTPEGGVLLAGSVETELNHDVQIMKIGAGGLTDWSAFVHWSDENRLTAVAPAEDGGYVLAGYTQAKSGSAAFTWLYHIDAYGDSLWVDTTGPGLGESVDAIVPRKSGGYLLGGAMPQLGRGNTDFWIRDVDVKGKLRREWIYGDRYADRVLDLQELEGGDVLVGGTTRPYLGAYPANQYHGPFVQPWLQRLAPSGESRWSVTLEDTLDAVQVSVRSTGPESYSLGSFLNYGMVSKSAIFGASPPVSLLAGAGRNGRVMGMLPLGASGFDVLGRRGSPMRTDGMPSGKPVVLSSSVALNGGAR